MLCTAAFRESTVNATAANLRNLILRALSFSEKSQLNAQLTCNLPAAAGTRQQKIIRPATTPAHALYHRGHNALRMRICA